MLDFSTAFGQHAQRRLQDDQIIWLTTVDARTTPQPRPVWFHWDGQTLLIFSVKSAAKLRHIARNPRVAVNFNTNRSGGDVVALVGDAVVVDDPLPAHRVQSYLEKYREGLKDLGMTAEKFTDEYAARILVTPQALRGFA